MSLSDEKQQVSNIEEPRLLENHVDSLVEDEPGSIYEIKWRTVLAVFALSLSNVCAALANTVRRHPSNAT
jgi:hypothetical protein